MSLPTASKLDVNTLTNVSFSGAGAIVTQAVKFSPSSTKVGAMLNAGAVKNNYTILATIANCSCTSISHCFVTKKT